MHFARKCSVMTMETVDARAQKYRVWHASFEYCGCAVISGFLRLTEGCCRTLSGENSITFPSLLLIFSPLPSGLCGRVRQELVEGATHVVG